MYSVDAWGKQSTEAEFTALQIERNAPGPDDVTFSVKYCGVCHSDVHIALNHTGMTRYPIVPGHELAGIVTGIGNNVKDYKVGDRVGVGCISDSCMDCKNCKEGEEHTCDNQMTGTYNGVIKHGHIKTNLGHTCGGYSRSQTVNKQFLIRVPDSYPLEAAGPVFCAGITMYSPLSHWGAVKGGMNVGIIGIGGLGQMGIKLAKAMGNNVTAISTSIGKKEHALNVVGADRFVVSTDKESMAGAANTLDLVLNTVSASHQLSLYLPLLRRDSTLVQLGAVFTDHTVNQIPLIMKRISIAGSCIGGMTKTQECMDFCAKHNIILDTKLITNKDLDHVYKVLDGKNDQSIRYVLDIQKCK